MNIYWSEKNISLRYPNNPVRHLTQTQHVTINY